jgi:hypothetical protein
MDIHRWAKALLTLRNLTICVIDTTGLQKDADIIRLYTLDRHGNFDADLTMTSERHPDSPNTDFTGITMDEFEVAGSLKMFWNDIYNAVSGNFMLAYGFDFIQERLDENAKHYGLEPIFMIGDDLMHAAIQYFRSPNYGLKLTDACARIGYTLPARPDAIQRAKGQFALLSAMAKGPYQRPARPVVTPDDQLSKDMEERPF